MSYSIMTHALIGYIECNLNRFSLAEMSERFGFSEIYLRELFLKHVRMPIMKYYRRRRIISSAFELLHSDMKIVDIALENGFSSHESYTRAFRKVFGMSPSQFRRSRPPIGGAQLDTGVFGLERLDEKKKRSDEFMTIQKSHQDPLMLYGIRKIEHGAYGSSTMFPICIKAVSEYLGDDVSYAYIMAATGAAFRLVWNREDWDLCNVDIYHTLQDSNEIYRYGAIALGREFSFLERHADTEKEEFTAYIRSNLAKGIPVIALGVIGPPEPCIIAGYDPVQDAVMGWNFFRHDLQFASTSSTLENGYFHCSTWWENTDTQALMCIGPLTDVPYGHKEILRMAAAIMEPRDEGPYVKGIRAYDAWKHMLLDEKWFGNSSFDSLYTRLLVLNDAMGCISDGRKLADGCKEQQAAKCLAIAESFRKVSSLADKMMHLVIDWNDTEKMLRNFCSRSVRDDIGRLIDAAKEEDALAYGQIRTLLEQM